MIPYALRLFLSQVKRFRVPGAIMYYARWRNSLRPGASSVRDRQPWITFKAIGFLKKWIKKEHRIFEYGGGGSSLFFADRASEVITIEHDEEWFAQLDGLASRITGCRWSRLLIPPSMGTLVPEPDPGKPEHYSSADLPSKGKNYKLYVQAIDRYPEDYFDLVMVDGRSRPACIQHGFHRLRKGGLLVLDNAERVYYLKNTAPLFSKMELVSGGMGPVPYSMDFSNTSIWKKIED